MKYWVTMLTEGRYIVGVEADSLDEAAEKAQEEWENADFGELSDIDGYAINAEDEDGVFHDYE